ncbi:hypothetical protein SAMN02982929_04553 [Saccharopolyspora kobensis]|uniref:Uncharacterized protein n=1 Tax=Saccharopolyspora kobensis TaxID=146035 RepID=A0A1H6DKC1_9PSEU|nr:hypothetical protein SAMN02982929_04553 [Saccharopolyspora kobensis]SFD24988.1 hypothetical protein SAMN05216506_103237 [Saccharopolyspora kobensis]
MGGRYRVGLETPSGKRGTRAARVPLSSVRCAQRSTFPAMKSSTAW